MSFSEAEKTFVLHGVEVKTSLTEFGKLVWNIPF